MFEAEPQYPASQTRDAAGELLAELERNTPEEIRRQRAHFRVSVRAKVVIQPGNSSDVQRLKVQGVTGDLSEGGCRVLSPVPLRVGDVYRLTFNTNELPLPMTFSRCTRCQLLREDAFDTGFRFFSPVALPESLAARADELMPE